jgi:hypothetical protein
MSDDQIMKFVEQMPDRKMKDGTGKAVQQVAKRLGIGSTKISQIRKLEKEAPPELLEQVRTGEKSVRAAYFDLTKGPGWEEAEKAKEAEKAFQRYVETETEREIDAEINAEVEAELEAEALATEPASDEKSAPQVKPETPRGPEKPAEEVPAIVIKQKPEPVLIKSVPMADYMKASVTLLAEAKMPEAAMLLVNHFIRRQKERGAFMLLLREDVRAALAGVADGAAEAVETETADKTPEELGL